MNDQELRQMIRDSIARHAAASALAPVANITQYQSVAAAFSKFPTLRSGDDDGACVIEPSVRCNRCGYCLSYGH